MKKAIVISLFAILIASCSKTEIKLPPQMIDYSVGRDRYAVVVVIENGSKEMAKNAALQRAAELVSNQGNRYFTIHSETEVQVTKTFDDQTVADLPALRVVVEAAKKPLGAKTIDIRQWIPSQGTTASASVKEVKQAKK